LTGKVSDLRHKGTEGKSKRKGYNTIDRIKPGNDHMIRGNIPPVEFITPVPELLKT